jgi:hypothetical protein
VLVERDRGFPDNLRLAEPRGALVELRRCRPSRLLLSTLVDQRSDLRLVSEAVPGAVITVVRLHAPLPVLEQRIRLREPDAPESELVGARWWMQHFNEVQVEEYVVETENRPAGEIARELLRLADWLR